MIEWRSTYQKQSLAMMIKVFITAAKQEKSSAAEERKKKKKKKKNALTCSAKRFCAPRRARVIYILDLVHSRWWWLLVLWFVQKKKQPTTRVVLSFLFGVLFVRIFVRLAYGYGRIVERKRERKEKNERREAYYWYHYYCHY